MLLYREVNQIIKNDKGQPVGVRAFVAKKNKTILVDEFHLDPIYNLWVAQDVDIKYRFYLRDSDGRKNYLDKEVTENSRILTTTRERRKTNFLATVESS